MMNSQYTGRLPEKLSSRGMMMATAESCTGGMIAQWLTAIPGSSAWFAGSVVSYDNSWKAGILGVPETTLEEKGAVSAETVHAMLDGILKCPRTDAAVAVSGIAGPGGGTPEKPVGTVVIGAALNNGARKVEICRFQGDRDEVRRQSAQYALQLLESLL
ncbi:MAG: CinA family protein [Victivallales bacterium]|nr:CinA family protein [Victivallales bacterium]